ncbi:MATE family efflux transporter [Desulfovibrio sp. ZJ369]|uniref:MATE family efflux transporter n=1 Tax=Desulfovibrio sp. ZJ369 TaxID=2709793 RepID=UPI0013EC35DD|nr:MATE family efflux transporter [Desulfovibrio sp. ZJ369]
MIRSFFSWAEARRFYAIGLPIFIAQLSQTGMNFADTAMTGQYNAEDMAAVAVAGSVWAPAALLGIGCLLALPPLSAQMVGGGQREGAAHLLRQGLWLTLGMSLLLMTFFYVISWRLESFGLTPELARLAGGYLRAMLWGLPGFMFFVNQRSFLEGFSRTRPAMIIGMLGLALNIPCNYVLIYGKCGLPALGAVGCGVATALCYWFMALAMLYYLRRDPQYRDLRPLFAPLFFRRGLSGRRLQEPRFDGALALRVLRIGLPGALALFFEVSLFALSAILLAPLGTVMVAGHQIVMNFSALVFMIPLAVGMTATIRVGHYLGAGKVARARLAARTALALSVVFALLIALCAIVFRHGIVLIYNDDPAVTALAMHLLFYVAAYQLVDGLQMAGIGILRGHNDTRIISAICFLAYWVIGLPLGYALARTDIFGPPRGAEGFWIAYIFALGFGAACYLWRVRFLHGLGDAEALARVRR